MGAVMIEVILLLMLALSIVTNVIIYFKLIRRKDEYGKLLSQKKSSEVVLGQISEQLAPFTENFKYEPHKVKFLGQPVDYIYFGDDKIVILEVKSGNAKLTQKQVLIKKLITEGKVFWDEYRIPEKVKKPEPRTEEELSKAPIFK